jgi:peptide/nickel transport system ATP-binding protein|tara:strand:- start:1131 stop:2096 length:966 start_codon:yes stop_codon:yes gene_type:complete
MKLLELHNLKLYYQSSRGAVRAVDDISLDLAKGEALGIVGESGSGKTSLSLALMRVLPSNIDISEGKVILNGNDITQLSEEEFRKEIRWNTISMIFQGSMNSLNPVLKVGHQIAEPLLLENTVNKKEAYKKAEDLLEMVGLSKEIFNRYAHELSGGMKQRVMIASALIQNPKLVILDEPTSALDVSIQAQIMNLLKRFKQELDISMIFITHDIALSSDLCDKLAVLYAGEIIEKGTAEQMYETPKHPYTQLLLASMPRLKQDVPPTFIPGAPPDLTSPPTGCRFYPRCPYRFDPCDKRSPPAFKIEKGHLSRCWLNDGGKK